MYVPLRNHGYHSLLTGVDAPATLLGRARDLGLEALALTDVDSLAGLVDFLSAAKELASGSQGPGGVQGPRTPNTPAAGESVAARPTVRPIVGAEISSAAGPAGGSGSPGGVPAPPGGLIDPPAGLIDPPGRLIALVESAQGYANLCRLVSARQLGFDPGDEDVPAEEREAGSAPPFDRVAAAVRYQEGLIYLVDHPRLLLELFGRVPSERLFAAIAPACLQRGSRDSRVGRGGQRNTHGSEEHRRSGAGEGSPGPAHGDSTGKTPSPEPCQPAGELIDAARATGVATLAVPDVYWAYPTGAAEHRVRVAVHHNALLEQVPRDWLASEPGHLLAGAELNAWFQDLSDVPGPFAEQQEAYRKPGEESLCGMLLRTRLVADRCRFVPELGGVRLPHIELPAGESPYSKLCELAFEGARRRYRPLRPEVLHRLDDELSTIHRLGYAPYFLLVERIVEYAREEGIPFVGRGSAADSLVAFCLGLTDADPLRYRLPFERFLNPARQDRPDIDLDFCWKRRDDVLEHVYRLFGLERTAMISTVVRFGLRAAFREAALAMGIPPVEVTRWSKRLPMYPMGGAPSAFDGTVDDDGDSGESDSPDTDPEAIELPIHPALREVQSDLRSLPGDLAQELSGNPIAHALTALPEGRHFPFDDARFVRALRAAAGLIGVPRHFGLHPGGVIVSPGPITDFVACQRAAKGCIVTQLDKDGVEAVGLVKMDLLGNRALTVLSECLTRLGERDIHIDLEGLPEDDPATAETLRHGRTLGCFQIESPGMRNLLQQTGAANMDAVIQAVALIRPGPASSGMKDAFIRRFRGEEAPQAPHPRLTDVLNETYGVMLYQEDVMQTAAAVAGLDLAHADQLRRALQKKRHGDLVELRKHFLEGALAEDRRLGVPPDREAAEQVWELVANFASFAFNKAHSVTYGRIAYRAAWLKTHYPALFLVAFLASETGYYAPRVYIEEARRLGVTILPPDINRSPLSFEAEGLSRTKGIGPPALRIGLGQVKGLSQRTLERILETREQDGAFLSLPDFLERTRAHSDEVRSLIQCGALDGFDRTRPELLWRLHLLRTPQARRGRNGLDEGQLAACQQARGPSPIDRARDRSQGWSGRGLGVTGAQLGPGQTASLFPDPDTPALALPRLPDPDPLERGRLEYELLGMTIEHHPIELFPCPADQRIAQRFGNFVAERGGALAAHGRFHSRGSTTVDHEGRNSERAELRPVNPIPCGDLARYRGGRVTLRGWPAASRHVRTVDGELMRFLTLEDTSGLAEAVIFPDVYRQVGERLHEFGPLLITGIVEDTLGSCTLTAEMVW